MKWEKNPSISKISILLSGTCFSRAANPPSHPPQSAGTKVWCSCRGGALFPNWILGSENWSGLINEQRVPKQTPTLANVHQSVAHIFSFVWPKVLYAAYSLFTEITIKNRCTRRALTTIARRFFWIYFLWCLLSYQGVSDLPLKSFASHESV